MYVVYCWGMPVCRLLYVTGYIDRLMDAHRLGNSLLLLLLHNPGGAAANTVESPTP